MNKLAEKSINKKYTLVLVESPAKAKTISKYLGKDFKVVASYGHIRDLPSGNKNRKRKGVKSKTKLDLWIDKIGLDPYNGWKAKYEIPSEKLKLVQKLKSYVNDADKVYLATDPDREGEAIAWHLSEILCQKKINYKRIIFNSITKSTILESIKNPCDININYVYAQQTRRFLDRLVGFIVSPVLWKKIVPGLSAGRVQTPAVALVVDRENEIANFVKKKYVEIYGDFFGIDRIDFSCKLVRINEKVFKGDEESEAIKNLLSQIRDVNSWIVTSINCKNTNLEPQPPFITSSLQQVISQRFKYSVKKIMTLAQRLYENGYITYMRTDSVHVSNDAIVDVRKWIKTNLSDKYLPENPRKFKSKKLAQEAHEAIRPTNLDLKKIEEIRLNLGESEAKVYQIIFDRFVASQVQSSKLSHLKYNIEDENRQFKFEYVCKKILFDGWIKIVNFIPFIQEKPAPDFSDGDKINLKKLDLLEKTTSPPSRYTEAKLVKELEKCGIGRPSTYASILDTIKVRGYVRLENGLFYAEKLGLLIVNRLLSSFSDFFTYKFTSDMEIKLDKIANCTENWQILLDETFQSLNNLAEKAICFEDNGGMKNISSITCEDLYCPSCSSKLELKYGRFGMYLKCVSNDKDTDCKQSIKLYEKEKWPCDPQKIDNYELVDKHCYICKSIMYPYTSGNSLKLFWLCNKSPDCNGIIIQDIDKPFWGGVEDLGIKCYNCKNTNYIRHIGRFGNYIECIECNTKSKLVDSNKKIQEKIAIPFPEIKSSIHKDGWFYLRESKSGVFFASNLFPKVRESRAPKVSEIKKGIDRLPEKWRCWGELMDYDPDGNPTYIRYSAKLKQYYLGSKKDSDSSKWTNFKYFFEK